MTKLTATSKLVCILNVSHTTDNSHTKWCNNLINITNHHGIIYTVIPLFTLFRLSCFITFILSHPGSRSPCSQLPTEKQMVILIVKPSKDNSFATSYRPTGLTSCSCKSWITCKGPTSPSPRVLKSYSKCKVWVLISQIQQNRQPYESGAPYLQKLFLPSLTWRRHDTTWWYSILNRLLHSRLSLNWSMYPTQACILKIMKTLHPIFSIFRSSA